MYGNAGHNTAGIHGYSQLTGGWEGGQADFARVVFGVRLPRISIQ